MRPTLDAAVRWHYIGSNTAKAVGPNPQPHAIEIRPLTIPEVERIAEELGPIHGALVVVGAETALPPSELAGLDAGRSTARQASSVSSAPW